MGLDGGTIISRSDVLRGSSWELTQADNSKSTRGGSISQATVRSKRKLNDRESRKLRWSSCALSGERLSRPVVADYLGNIYNKTVLLEYLLARQGVFSNDSSSHKYLNQVKSAGLLEHIQSIKDVFEIELGSLDDGSSQDSTPFRCPITDIACDSGSSFLALPCGHVLSEKAVVNACDKLGSVCPICNKEFERKHAVFLIPTDEQREILESQLQERQNMVSRSKKGGGGKTKRRKT